MLSRAAWLHGGLPSAMTRRSYNNNNGLFYALVLQTGAHSIHCYNSSHHHFWLPMRQGNQTVTLAMLSPKECTCQCLTCQVDPRVFSWGMLQDQQPKSDLLWFQWVDRVLLVNKTGKVQQPMSDLPWFPTGWPCSCHQWNRYTTTTKVGLTVIPNGLTASFSSMKQVASPFSTCTETAVSRRWKQQSGVLWQMDFEQTTAKLGRLDSQLTAGEGSCSSCLAVCVSVYWTRTTTSMCHCAAQDPIFCSSLAKSRLLLFYNGVK